jgi:hypothetical protein
MTGRCGETDRRGETEEEDRLGAGCSLHEPMLNLGIDSKVKRRYRLATGSLCMSHTLRIL